MRNDFFSPHTNQIWRQISDNAWAELHETIRSFSREGRQFFNEEDSMAWFKETLIVGFQLAKKAFIERETAIAKDTIWNRARR